MTAFCTSHQLRVPLLVVACLFVGACQTAAPDPNPGPGGPRPAPVAPAPVDPAVAWATAAARAEAATFLGFDHFEHPTGDWYRAKFVAF